MTCRSEAECNKFNASVREMETENAKLRAEVEQLGRVTKLMTDEDLKLQNERLRNALIKISSYGRVCAEFETCKHQACEDSAGAALLAMDVLRGGKIPIRPELLKFAEAMEVVLQENDHKGSVTTVRCDEAVERLWDEVRELDRVAWGHISIITKPAEREKIKKEAVDVANFALMTWYGAQL